MNYWIEIFDKDDTNTIVDSFELTGTAYTFQNDEMQPGDIIFIYSTSEQRMLYRAIVEKVNAWTNEEGTVTYCDAYLPQPMIISDSLKKEALEKVGFVESEMKEEIPNKIENPQLLALLKLVFDNEDDYSTEDSHKEKCRIIYTAKYSQQ